MIIRILIGGVALLLLPINVAWGQTTRGASGTASGGIDVVMLIDQSGSMGGHPQYHPLANDRHNHRIGAVQSIVLRLAEHAEGTTMVHRVSVIDFGDTASVALSNYEVRYDPSVAGATVRNATATMASRVTSKQWVNTNTPDALRLAVQEYDKMAAASGQPGRRRVLLLLTDGRANLPGVGQSVMQRRIQQQATALKGKNTEIYVIGLNDTDNYWNRGDGAFWESVAGPQRARLAETASKNFATILQGIVDEWLGVTSRAVDDQYECPPYLRRIVFNVTFSTPRSLVRITDPDGNDIPTTVGGGLTRPGTFVRFIVDDPKPGTYTIHKDPSRAYTTYVEEFSAQIQRLTPVSDVTLNTPTRVVFQATNAQGKPLQLLKKKPINASVTVTDPSGAAQQLSATFSGDGKFETSLTPADSGLYRVRLKGMINLADGSTYDVFGANANSYDEEIRVSSLLPYTLRFDNINPASGIAALPFSQSARLAFALFDPQGNRVDDAASVATDPATWLSMESIDEAGNTLEGPTLLAYTPDGTFETSVPVDLDWTAGEGWWTSDQLNLRIVPQPDRLTGDNILHSLALPEKAENKRIGADPLTAGPLAVRYAWWIRGLLWLVVLAFVLALVLVFFRKMFLGLLLWWADTSRGRRVELRIYDAYEDPTGITAKRFPISNWNEFKLDRQLKLLLEDREVLASTLRVKRTLSVSDVAVEVIYKWQHNLDKDHAQQLRSGRPKMLKGLDSGNYVISLDVKKA